MKLVFAFVTLCCAFFSAAAQYQAHQLDGNTLHIDTDAGQVSLTFYRNDVVEAFYQPTGVKQLPSFSISQQPQPLTLQVAENNDSLRISSASLSVAINKSPLQLSYYRGDKLLLAEQPGYFNQDGNHGFRFALTAGEKLLGGGQRVLGMDRRGHKFPLYNKAHYGYSTASSQMYFSLPAVLSSNNYLLLFDNSAKGEADLGATNADVMQFSAEGGRSSYVLVAGNNYPAIIDNYTSLTGKPPLPARWTLGNYASRFGYRNEAQVRDVVKRFADLQLPLDALVIDLYWFGPDIQGHMGNLAWDSNAFPQPEKMLADLKADGINTILVTEPFVLTSSKRWQEAVEAGAIAPGLDGKPKTFDFYFGNTGLIDVFNLKARDWFWQIYKGLAEQGVAGVWGDLGEPEVHPDDTVHAIGMANEVHNAFGHQWADMVYSGMRRDFPEQRPFIMMRAGAPGSQRFGMVPWTGDVDRSWGGLKPQVELALSMGLFGFGYIHSDLGGFAGGEKFDKELYIRWLQYGVFQPVYRPHAQEHIAPEVVFHDHDTIDTLRPWLNLRYQLLPYNYSLAYQHSQSGLPLMRPLFLLDQQNPALMDENNSYLWGDAFLVAPVTEPGVKSWPVQLPGGVWFDYFSGKRYAGSGKVEVPVTLDTIPVLVKAGSFVPMVAPMANTRDYSSRELTLHFYADSSVDCAKGEMFEDDGKTPDTIAKGQFELLNFYYLNQDNQQKFELRRSGSYQGMPASRELTLVVHNQNAKRSHISVDGRYIQLVPQQARFNRMQNVAWYDKASRQLKVKLDWQADKTQLTIK
ncbi:glycoside hydrolase family 31 protein [Rheinheimera nanhaiensis]|uniref:Alpha 1,3-glucosidase n=1 Tax=Rheinheimera nanhaiensis E407-8 TaxID=562729 RepID=I1DXM8_9GAMM|nr:TIM-barrel domain-containing protein [Rheinheimera nanhaiensis]GAB58806.1 alpha 1,3-glucosidase [Rheinheimera nanhaiensis E407-8]